MIEEPRSDRIAGRSLRATWALLCAAAFVGLGASSLWVDELSSWYIASHNSPLEVLRAALADFHPPLSHLLHYFWREIFGDGVAAGRSLSAILAVLGSVVLFLGLKPFASPLSRSFAVAIAVGTKNWFEQSQNQRMYAIAFFFAASYLVCVLSALRRMREGEEPHTALLAAFSFGLLGSLTHHYLFVAVGFGIIYLLYRSQNARLRALVVAAGAIIFCVQALVIWLVFKYSPASSPSWFKTTTGFFAEQIEDFLQLTFDRPLFVLVAMIFAVAAVGMHRRWRASGEFSLAGSRQLALELALVTLVGTLLVALASTLFVVANFSGRNLTVLLPWLWLATALATDEALAVLDRRRAAVGAALAVVAALPLLSLVPLRLKPHNEEWRASALYVSSLKECMRAPLDVQLAWTPDFSGYAYRFYLPIGAIPELHPVDVRDLLYHGGIKEWATRAITRARTSSCPILLWSVREIDERDIERIRAELATAVGPITDRPVQLRSFAHHPLTRDFLGTRMEDGTRRWHATLESAAFVLELGQAAADVRRPVDAVRAQPMPWRRTAPSPPGRRPE